MEWEDEEFFDNADDYYSSLLQFCNEARSSIDLEVYIFEKSTIGDRVLKTLQDAAHRGVTIRLMVDGVGSLNFLNTHNHEIEKLNIKIYHPVPWQRWTTRNTKISTGWWPATFFQLFGSMNSRNHRKVCIIDQQLAFLGSYNISDVHLSEIHRAKAWRDFGVRVRGECVKLLTLEFEKAWQNSIRENMKLAWLKQSSKLDKFYRYFLLNHSVRTRFLSRQRMLNHIKISESRIWLVTPYFVPTARLIRLLKTQAEAGVDVRLLLPRTVDIVFMHWIMRSFYAVLIESGVKIYEYLPSVLHAKAAILDDWHIVGSMNLNFRSILHDLEANYIFQTKEEKKKLEMAIERDFKLSDLILKGAPYPWYEYWLGRILLLFKYWI